MYPQGRLWAQGSPGRESVRSARSGLSAASSPGTAHNGVLPPSALSVLAPEEEDGRSRNVEAVLEAERLWWAEGAERHTKELEGMLEREFQKASQHLRSDLERCIDIMEVKLETEKRERIASVAGVRRELDVAREATLKQVAAERDSAEARHPTKAEAEVLWQNVTEMKQGVEQLREQHEALERRLQQDLEALRWEMEACTSQQCAEISTALEQTGDRLAQSVMDECEERSMEAKVLQARLDALNGKFVDLEATTLASKVEVERMRNHAPQAPLRADTAANPDVRAVERTLEGTRVEIAEMKSQMASEREACQGAIAAARRHAEDVAAGLLDRMGSMSKALEDRLKDIIAQESEDHCAAIDDLRGLVREGVKAAEYNISDNTLGRETALADVVGEQSLRELHAELRGELSALRTALHRVDADCRRCSEAVTAGADAAKVAGEVRTRDGLLPRLDALEDGLLPRLDALEVQVGSVRAGVTRVESVEAELKEAANARESEVLQLKDDLRRVSLDLAPLVARLEDAEADARRSKREVLPLTQRQDSTESTMRQLLRDTSAAFRDIEFLRADLQGFKDTDSVSRDIGALKTDLDKLKARFDGGISCDGWHPNVGKAAGSPSVPVTAGIPTLSAITQSNQPINREPPSASGSFTARATSTSNWEPPLASGSLTSRATATSNFGGASSPSSASVVAAAANPSEHLVAASVAGSPAPPTSTQSNQQISREPPSASGRLTARATATRNFGGASSPSSTSAVVAAANPSEHLVAAPAAVLRWWSASTTAAEPVPPLLSAKGSFIQARTAQAANVRCLSADWRPQSRG